MYRRDFLRALSLGTGAILIGNAWYKPGCGHRAVVWRVSDTDDLRRCVLRAQQGDVVYLPKDVTCDVQPGFLGRLRGNMVGEYAGPAEQFLDWRSIEIAPDGRAFEHNRIVAGLKIVERRGWWGDVEGYTCSAWEEAGRIMTPPSGIVARFYWGGGS